ncbi:hypothetical protein ABFS83_09G118300 [Erythranthe nasuta]
MSEAIITVVLTQITTIIDQQIRQEFRLVSGVEKEIKKLESEFKSLRAVLADAEKRQVKDQTIKIWLEKLADVSYDAEDLLSEWITAVHKSDSEGGQNPHSSPTQKVCSFISLPCLGCNRYALRRDIAVKIKRINERLSLIAIEKDRYKFNPTPKIETLDRPRSTSFVDVSEIEGRDSDKRTLIDKMLSLSDKNRVLNVVSIVGLGGIGKTTLAQVVYNSSDVIDHFERRIWVCVSDPFDEIRVAKAIVEDVEGSAPHLFELETLAKKIRTYVQGNKFLLVLDDVWTEDCKKWENLFNSLKTGAPGSTILVTTRNERVAIAMRSLYNLPLGQLSGPVSWSLFKKIAFFDRKKEECEELEGIGKLIAEKCKGLPLTITTIGSLMRFKNSLNDWKAVLSSEFWGLGEETEEGPFPALLLSYYNLPPNEKRCFSFCAFFPKDYIIDADNLIHLWMAQGCLISNDDVAMEVRGQEYLQNLAMRSFFQDLVREKNGEKILTLKMHDMVHDFAQYLTRNECSVIELNNDFRQKMESLDKKPRHLTIVRSEDSRFPDNIPNVEKVLTFWVQSFHDSPPIRSQLDRIEPEFFLRSTCLRALDLSRNRIGELPIEVENSSKLKYLNLSHNPFSELPSNLCNLYNLQTLKLSACNHLQKLPEEIGKLVNLRHLEIDRTDNLKALPKGIGELKSLQTLSKFIIGRGDNNATCGIEELGNLNNLRGCQKIEGLGNVADADVAKKAQMHKKIHLTDLHMDFGNSARNRIHDEVIEALELNENLQSLAISSFGGTKFPNWMMNLTKLQKLFLQDCQNCIKLPPLGKLPFLVTLDLEGMNAVKFIGLDFSRDPLNVDAKSVFPKLKKLKISKMENLEEWDLIGREDGGIFRDGDFEIMPRLRCLKVSNCSNLKALPNVLLQRVPLKKLRIDNCTLLREKYRKGTGEDWKKISHIKKIRVS